MLSIDCMKYCSDRVLWWCLFACRFVVVQHGLEERRTPGNTLAVQPDKPYQGLSMFGTGAHHPLAALACIRPSLAPVAPLEHAVAL